MEKKKLLLWSLLLVVLTAEGCATIRGMGDDIQSIVALIAGPIEERHDES